MGNLTKGHYRVVSMNYLTILGSVASILGVILTLVFRAKDRKNHKTKESSRTVQS